MRKGWRDGWLATALALVLLAGPGCGGGSSASESWEEDAWEEEEGDLLGDLVFVAVAVGVEAASGEDGDDGRRRRHWLSARSDLVRDPGSGDGDDRGFIAVRASRRAEELLLVAEGLPGGRAVEFLVEGDSGGEYPAGRVVARLDGRAALLLRSGGWDALPAGTPSVADLAGRPVAVRDEGGLLLLRGRVPPLPSGAGVRRTRSFAADGETGVSARATLFASAPAGRRTARVDLRGLPPGAGVTLLVSDAGGRLREAGGAVASEAGTARFLFDSRRGDPLPGGAEDVADLAGRAFAIRVAGDTVLEGSL